MGPAASDRLSRVRSYSGADRTSFPCRLQDFHLLWSPIPECSTRVLNVLLAGPTTPAGRVRLVWAGPRSLAATDGVAFAFLSSGYGDVSVPRVRSARLWIERAVIRVSRSQRSFDSSTGLIAVCHALLRLLAPRHPPRALSSLAALIPSSARHFCWARAASAPSYYPVGQLAAKPFSAPCSLERGALRRGFCGPPPSGESNDPNFSLRLMQRSQETSSVPNSGAPCTPPTRTPSLVNCNFYRCQIVKEQ
jgi:hypothetical protein